MVRNARLAKRLRTTVVVGLSVISLGLTLAAPASQAAAGLWTTIATFQPEDTPYYGPTYACAWAASWSTYREYGHHQYGCGIPWPLYAWSRNYYTVPAGKSVDRIRVRLSAVKGSAACALPDFKLKTTGGTPSGTYWYTTSNVTNSQWFIDTTTPNNELGPGGISIEVGFNDLGRDDENDPYCTSGPIGFIDWVKLDHFIPY